MMLSNQLKGLVVGGSTLFSPFVSEPSSWGDLTPGPPAGFGYGGSQGLGDDHIGEQALTRLAVTT